MKKLLFIFTLFLSLHSIAQKPAKFQDVAARYGWLGGNFYLQLGFPQDTFAVTGVDTLFAWVVNLHGHDSLYLYNKSVKRWNLFSGGSGEINTTSNVGGGVGLAKAKSGFDLPFKSLVEGPGISFTVAANTVTINSTITQYTDSLAKSSVDLVNGLIYNPITGIGKLGGFLTQNTLFANRDYGFDFGTNANRLDHFAVYTKANIFLGDSTAGGSTPSVYLHNGIIEINAFNSYITGDHQVVLTATDSIMVVGIGSSVDTTKYKPLARAANGKIIQFTRWPGGGGAGPYTGSNGIQLISSDFSLGGALTSNVTFPGGPYGFRFGTSGSPMNGFDVYAVNNTTINTTSILTLQSGALDYITSPEVLIEGTTSVKITGSITSVVDTTTFKLLVIASDGTLKKAPWLGGGVATNIYTADGTISANRTVTLSTTGYKSLHFTTTDNKQYLQMNPSATLPELKAYGISNDGSVQWDWNFTGSDWSLEGGKISGSGQFYNSISADVNGVTHYSNGTIDFNSTVGDIQIKTLDRGSGRMLMRDSSTGYLTTGDTLVIGTGNKFALYGQTLGTPWLYAGYEYDAGGSYFFNSYSPSSANHNHITAGALRTTLISQYDTTMSAEIMNETDLTGYNILLEGKKLTGSQAFMQIEQSGGNNSLTLGYDTRFNNSTYKAQRFWMDSTGNHFTGSKLEYTVGNSYHVFDETQFDSYLQDNTTATKFSEVFINATGTYTYGQFQSGYGTKSAGVYTYADASETYVDIGASSGGTVRFGNLLHSNSTANVILVMDSTSTVVGTIPVSSLGGGGGGSYTADESTLHLASSVFSIKSTYTGQTSLTTLGTITTGTWNAGKLTATLTTEQFRAAYDGSNYTTTTVASTGQTTYDIVGSAQQFIWSQDMAEYGTITRFKMGEAAIYPEGLQLKYNGGTAISYISASRQLEISASTGDPEDLANGGKINFFSTGTGTVAIGGFSTGSYKFEMYGTTLLNSTVTFGSVASGSSSDSVLVKSSGILKALAQATFIRQGSNTLTSTLQLNGPVYLGGSVANHTYVHGANTNYSVATDDYFVVLNDISGGSNLTLTIPGAGPSVGRELVIVYPAQTGGHTWASSVTLTKADGTSGTSLTAGTTYKIKSDGTTWWIISAF